MAMMSYYRNIRSINEKRQAADPEISGLIRAKRGVACLPELWDDKPRGRKKISTKRQRRRSHNNYRNSIRFLETI